MEKELKTYRGKHCIVTGAAGFIGSNLVNKLIELGAHVYAIDNLVYSPKDNIHPKAVFIKGDVRDAHIFKKLPKQKYHYLFHFAGPSSTILFDRDLVESTSITQQGFLNCLQYCASEHIRFVYPSSGSLYAGSDLPHTETKSLNLTALNTYAKNKLMIEQLAAVYWPKIHSLGLRILAGFGPGEDHKGEFASVVYTLCRSMYVGKSPVIWGDGTQRRDFIFIDDIVRITLILAVNCDEPIINVGKGTDVDFLETVKLINNELKTDIKPTFIPRPQLYLEITLADTKLLKKYYKGSFTSVKEGIHKTIKYLDEINKIDVKVPFVDLHAQYKHLEKDVQKVLHTTLEESYFVHGHQVQNFEEEFARYIGTTSCVAVNSGTDALLLGMRALNLDHGGEVLMATNSFFAAALSASENGLKPVFCDIDEKDNGINLDDLKRKITSRTRAIILVHLYGQPDKIDEVRDIIKTSHKNILLIEDACQAHGAMYKSHKAGTYGIFSAYSFYPTKNLGAYGDGGAIVTSDSQLTKKLRMLREYGQIDKYHHEIIGLNSRLDTIQAAILSLKLKHLDNWNKKRQQLASDYTQLIKKQIPSIKPPSEFKDRKSIYHLYTIQAQKRDLLWQYLHKKGVITHIHYPVPLHLQRAYSYLKYKPGDLPISEEIAHELLSLPLYPEISAKSMQYVVETIKSFYT